MGDDKKFQRTNLSEVVAMIAKRQTGLSPSDIKEAIDITMDCMSDALSQGERIEIRRFGSFSLHKRKQNLTRNLKTSKVVLVPERFSPHFKPSAQLKERVNNSSSSPSAASTPSEVAEPRTEWSPRTPPFSDEG